MFILTGDYLCSHLFHLLYETEKLFLLERFSALITAMNEGFSSEEKHRLKRSKPGKLRLRNGSTSSTGFFTGKVVPWVDCLQAVIKESIHC